MNLKTFIATIILFFSIQMIAKNTWISSTDNDWHEGYN